MLLYQAEAVFRLLFVITGDERLDAVVGVKQAAEAAVVVQAGHDVGDIVLKSIAQTVLSCIRKTDAVIRYGGDEFVIVFYSIPADVFEKRLERIRYSVNSLILDDLPEQHISVSIGGCYGIGTAKKLFKVADDMMYQSKNTKNKVTVCFRNEKAGGTDDI